MKIEFGKRVTTSEAQLINPIIECKTVTENANFNTFTKEAFTL